MARVRKVQIVDDIDGVSEAQETVLFSLEGTEFEIHLTTVHAAEFRTLMSEWTQCARKVRQPRKGAPSAKKAQPVADKAPGTDRAENRRIRAWAAENGFELEPRGRIRIDVRNAYFDAHME